MVKGYKMPDGFLWGAAVAAHQLEGAWDVNVFLGAQIKKGNLRSVPLKHFLLVAGNLLYHFSCCICFQSGDDCIQVIVLINCDHSVHGSLLTKDLSQCSGINSCDSRNVVFAQKMLNSVYASEVAGNS